LGKNKEESDSATKISEPQTSPKTEQGFFGSMVSGIYGTHFLDVSIKFVHLL